MSETTGRGRARKAPPAKTRAQRLEADRDRLEELIAKASASSLPNLVREHRIVLAELDQLKSPAEKGSTRDQLAERRAARKSTARKPDAARTPPA